MLNQNSGIDGTGYYYALFRLLSSFYYSFLQYFCGSYSTVATVAARSVMAVLVYSGLWLNLMLMCFLQAKTEQPWCSTENNLQISVLFFFAFIVLFLCWLYQCTAVSSIESNSLHVKDTTKHWCMLRRTVKNNDKQQPTADQQYQSSNVVEKRKKNKYNVSILLGVCGWMLAQCTIVSSSMICGCRELLLLKVKKLDQWNGVALSF